VKSLSIREEAVRILKLAGDDHLEALQVVERQLGVVVLRTQVVLSLCGIVITVTGFSGRAIAQTSFSARLSISIGICVVLLAAATAIMGVLRVQWLTQVATDEPLSTVENAIQIRQRKAKYLAVSLLLFVSGFALYCAAIAQLLMAQPTT
jgi:hypothetical protein